MSNAPVSTLPGLGLVTEGWLAEVGISTVGQLRAVGSVEAYRRLRFTLAWRVSLNALYALEAALRGCHWLDLPVETKNLLQHEARAIDEAHRRGTSTRCILD